MEKNMNQNENMYFNLNTKVDELLNTTEMKHSMARPGAKQAWLNFLQAGDATGFEETDRNAVDRALDLINTYALLVAYEQFHTDAHVTTFMETLEKMSQGQDLHNQMVEVVAKLPEAFKDAVHKASLHAQEFLYNKIKIS